MKHIDLFTGVGGFALAAQWVWGAEYENVFFCDNNEFCREVIKKNFGKESIIYGEVREVTKGRVIADTTRGCRVAGAEQQGIHQEEAGNSQTNEHKTHNTGSRFWPIDLLTGGFPCQPFSQAGKRKGTEDNRYLWPEMYRVIKDFKPRWVIAENVYGILNIDEGMVFEQVCLDLEGIGYSVQAFIIPAVSTNAPHRRDRVWIVAHGTSRKSRKQTKQERWKNTRRGNRENAPDSEFKGQQKSEHKRNSKNKTQNKTGLDNRFERQSWNTNWLEVATKFCRVDDGLPVELDGLKLTKAGHRVERLKALGNAIVPQVAVEIMEAIKEVEVVRR